MLGGVERQGQGQGRARCLTQTGKTGTDRAERVRGDDPLQLGLLDVEVLANSGQRDEYGSSIRGLRSVPSVAVAVGRHVDAIQLQVRVGEIISCVSRACERGYGRDSR